MSDHQSKAAKWITKLIAEDQAYDDDERAELARLEYLDYRRDHEGCTGHECDLEDDVTDCPYYMDNAQAMEDRQDDE